MKDRMDDMLDEALGRHFHEQLDGHVGRSACVFGAYVAKQRRMRLWVSMGGALAAGLLIAWGVLFMTANKVESPHGPVAIDPATRPDDVAVARNNSTIPVQTATWTRTMDNGLGYYNNLPMRQLRRGVVEQVEWYDPANKAVIRTNIPREEIYYIGVKTN